MEIRQQHREEVQAFLQQHFSNLTWELTIPHGSGNETYFARCNRHAYFVKLGAPAIRYLVVASIGLTPQVLAAGYLPDGTSIIVQPYILGKRPTRKDYRLHLEQFALAIRAIHNSTEAKLTLPEIPSNLHCAMGLASLNHIRQKWERYKPQVPGVATFIDDSLDDLGHQLARFHESGSVASHNDICDGNWLISTDGQVYLIDLDSMSLDDPALDLGAILWWYYPPELRKRFLTLACYDCDTTIEKRMQVRMAMHCLNILLPREQSFDEFDPSSFAESLIDFRAVLAGRENPQGYDN